MMIAVVGAAECDDTTAGHARQVGRLLAERGVAVVCGGRGGVMAGVAEGANERGGVAIGILPGESRHEGNEYLSVAIATGLGEARNAIIARTCDAMIGIGGEYGTLSEIALALKMGKPVVSLGSWDVDARIVQVDSPERAVDAALEAL